MTETATTGAGVGAPGPPARATGPVGRTTTRLVAASTVAAWIAIACILVGLAIGSVPVENPHVQNCGVPFDFVLRANSDKYANPSAPPRGLTARQAESANRNRCRARVARRVIPATGLMLGGLVVGLGGLVMLLAGRRSQRRADEQSHDDVGRRPVIPRPAGSS